MKWGLIFALIIVTASGCANSGKKTESKQKTFTEAAATESDKPKDADVSASTDQQTSADTTKPDTRKPKAANPTSSAGKKPAPDVINKPDAKKPGTEDSGSGEEEKATPNTQKPVVDSPINMPGMIETHKMDMEAAKAFCRAKGQEVMLLDTNPKAVGEAYTLENGSREVEFQCIYTNAPTP